MAFDQEAWDKALSSGRATVRSSQTQTDVPKEQGLFGRIVEALSSRAKNARDMFGTFNRSQSTGLRQFGEAAATGIGIAGQVAGGVGDIIGETAIEAGKAVLDKDTEDEIANFVSYIGQSRPVQAASQAWQQFEQERPFASAAIGGAANIIGLTGTGAVGKAAVAPLKGAAQRAVSSVGRAAREGVEAALPRTTQAVRSLGRTVGEVSTSAATQLTGLSPQTISRIIRGDLPESVMRPLQDELGRVELANRARVGIRSALDDLSGIGSEYDVIRQSGQTVNIPVGGRVNVGDNVLREFGKPLTDALSEYGLAVDEAGRITRNIDSRPFDPQTISAIQDFVDTYGKTGELSADQFLNVRQAADRIAKWDSPDVDLAKAFVQTLRKNYDEIGKSQIDGLAELDARFAPMREELGMIERQFLTPKGELKDSAYSSLVNLTNKGREQTLARLEKYVPGITEDIYILRAVEDIASASGLKVATYGKNLATLGAGAFGFAAGGATGGLQGALLLFALTHPSIVVPFLRKYGELNRSASATINNIIKKFQTGAKLTEKEKSVLRQAFLDSSIADGEVTERVTGAFEE